MTAKRTGDTGIALSAFISEGGSGSEVSSPSAVRRHLLVTVCRRRLLSPSGRARHASRSRSPLPDVDPPVLQNARLPLDTDEATRIDDVTRVEDVHADRDPDAMIGISRPIRGLLSTRERPLIQSAFRSAAGAGAGRMRGGCKLAAPVIEKRIGLILSRYPDARLWGLHAAGSRGQRGGGGRSTISGFANPARAAGSSRSMMIMSP